MQHIAEEPWLSTSVDEDDDENEVLNDDAEEKLLFYPLCCVETSNPSNAFPTLEEALGHDLEEEGFDFLKHCPPTSCEGFFEQAIVLVNRCRFFVLQHRTEEDVGLQLDAYLADLKQTDVDDADDRLYKPVLIDDAVLMSLDELELLKDQKQDISSHAGEGDGKERNGSGRGTSSGPDLGFGAHGGVTPTPTQTLHMKISTLEAQLSRCKEVIRNLAGEDLEANLHVDKPKTDQPDNDTYYFSSYSYHSIHETMLKDSVRTSSYRDAILSNSESLFCNKVVLDIGCGTGVLSIFAAKAGARKVIAIDGSDIINEARDIVDSNGFGGTIICVRGKVETLLEEKALPLEPDEKVDVIVSEWMGYALLFETMLPSVIKARDAIMDTEGTMFPTCAGIFLEGASDDRLSYWDDVHGIDMTPMRGRVARELASGAGVEEVSPREITTDRVQLVEFDLNKCKDEELDFEVPFQLSPDVTKSVCKLDKLVVSFDVDFNVPQSGKCVSFSTGCQSTPTHWKQTVLWFDPFSGPPTLANGEVMRGRFRMGRNQENHREMDFHVVWEIGMNDSGGGSFSRRLNGRIETRLSA